ncbi:cytochrome o ubiquinol oxidase subunit IV [Vibrio sp. SS-MA-C1-2]|uniref:cytochrome o ubiquinol oxidase subunit IV n=1 Tax=Vibrio sp. SS-MA-C1-2 TaxID=2908646 RepID=UPI001F47A599|nr:cytochrome o ubiquinol oxidase subunit IV [Vibrio sp. SS-MA-C1-2]UJF17547.1 cytochrome o ubiquinol oxidase subunit IV [Vibrio sp. SS-MA-C1-2]
MSEHNVTIRDYVSGFILALILTALPFYLVEFSDLPISTIFTVIFICAIIQVVVHFKYFLHMQIKTEQGKWDMLSLVFTSIVAFIVIGGSIWIIINLNNNMMM